MTPRAAVLGCVLLVAGCGPTFYQEVNVRAGDPPPLSALDERLLGRSKGEVLAALGPPGRVLPLPAGDVFVYRRRSVDLSILQVNSGFFLPVGLPLYGEREGDRRDEAVMIFFDRQGRVDDTALGAGW